MLIVLNKYTKWKRTFNKIQTQIFQIKDAFQEIRQRQINITIKIIKLIIFEIWTLLKRYTK